MKQQVTSGGSSGMSYYCLLAWCVMEEATQCQVSVNVIYSFHYVMFRAMGLD